MSAAERVLVCEGAPRDLGFDQGRAARGTVRAGAAELPPWTRLGVELPELGLGDALAARAARDAGRFFPHMTERLAGLARGAGVSRAALGAPLARALGARGAAARASALLVAAERTGGTPLLARTLPPNGACRAWLVRRSAPEHDWRSIELACAELVPALCGVNERGLAVAALVFDPAPGTLIDCAAPALLLAQDCLQRWDGVQKAIEWCERRPAGGSAALLFADASGDCAQLCVEGAARSVRRPRGGVLACTGDALRDAELEKACAARVAGAAELADVLARGEIESIALLDPASRTLSTSGARFAPTE